jgi:GMP synthase-like glutamine amidotransferase
MICYIDLEHESWWQRRQNRLEHYGNLMDAKFKLEALAGQPCLVQRYADVSLEALRALEIQALLISGTETAFDAYAPGAFTEMHRLIRAAEWPILGFCAGLHLIATAHGVNVAPMRRLHPGEPDLTERSGPGYLKEWGFTPVSVVADDPLLSGLGPTPEFLEMHSWEVKQLPAGFRLLASTDACRVQVMRRADRPVYGTQFHPEAYTEGPLDQSSERVNCIYPAGYARAAEAGRTLLANFFQIVRAFQG